MAAANRNVVAVWCDRLPTTPAVSSSPPNQTETSALNCVVVAGVVKSMRQIEWANRNEWRRPEEARSEECRVHIYRSMCVCVFEVGMHRREHLGRSAALVRTYLYLFLSLWLLRAHTTGCFCVCALHTHTLARAYARAPNS